GGIEYRQLELLPARVHLLDDTLVEPRLKLAGAESALERTHDVLVGQLRRGVRRTVDVVPLRLREDNLGSAGVIVVRTEATGSRRQESTLIVAVTLAPHGTKVHAVPGLVVPKGSVHV